MNRLEPFSEEATVQVLLEMSSNDGTSDVDTTSMLLTKTHLAQNASNGYSANYPSIVRQKPQKVQIRKDKIAGCCRHCDFEERSSWITLCVVTLCNTILGLHWIAFSTYYVLITDYFNVSKSAAGWIGSVQNSIGLSIGIFISHSVKTYGCRVVLAFGGLLTFVSLFCSSFSNDIYSLFFLYGVLGGVGIGIVTICAVVAVQENFTNNRSLAQGLSMVGFSFGNVLGSGITSSSAELFGWKGALLIHAAIVAHFVPCGLMLNRRKILKPYPKETADTSTASTRCRQVLQETLDFSLLRNGQFTLFCLAIFFHSLSSESFSFHMPSRAASLGMTMTQGAILVSTIAVSLTLARIVCSFVSNLRCVDRTLMASGGIFISSAANLLMPLATTYQLSIAVCALYGTGIATSNTLFATILSDLFGIQIIARSLAISSLFSAAAALINTPFAGWIYDYTRDYSLSFFVIGLLQAVGAGCMLSVFLSQKLCHRTLKTSSDDTALETNS